MALWTPADTTEALWLDGADSATITLSGSAVTQWNDKSGNGRNVSQATSAARPAYSIGGFGGKNCLDFDGGDSLSRASGITSGTYTGPLNIYWVAARDTASGGTILTERTTSLVGVSQWFTEVGLRFISSDGLNNSSNNTIGLADFGNLSTGGGVVSHFHSPGSRDLLWLNGSSITVTAGTASNISGTAGFQVGRREGAFQFWDGKICEIIVVTTSQTTTQRQQFEGYLAWKWGLEGNLPVGHPYKSVPPTKPGNPEAVHFFFGGF
jgi:hypothetical protein